MKKILILLLISLFVVGCEYIETPVDEFKIDYVTYTDQVLESDTLSKISSLREIGQKGYDFKGWFFDEEFTQEATINNISSDVTLYAKWEIRKYKVTFLGLNDEIIKEEFVEYLQDASSPSDPITPGYRFLGWDKPFLEIDKDLVVNAVYDINEYTVIFKADGTVISTVSVDYNMGVSAPIAPVKEGYTFIKWDQDYSSVKSNMEINAVYEINKYTVTFKSGDDVLDTQTVNHGSSANMPSEPVKSGYRFLNWDKDFSIISSDLVVNAVFEEAIYTVRFLDYNGVIIGSFKVNYLDPLPLVSEPTREDYVFVGWDNFTEQVTGNIDLVALYAYNNIKITFDTVGGSTISAMGINYGDTMNLPTPVKSGYTFFKWMDQDGYEVVNNSEFLYENSVTFKAVWLEDYKSSGTQVNYLYNNSAIKVTMPTEYVQRTEDFRGVWVSHIVGDISRYTSKNQMMDQLNRVLDNMESWNMNAIIYHVRTHNDAFYPSANNPMASYVTEANFEDWDYLEWLINEAHKRGIEFHAWMNPYRVSSSTNISTITSKYASYLNNPASEAKYLLTGGSTILNPGEPYVRTFLIDTVLEFINKYDVDAVHFDDYFYISGVDDSATYNKYKGSFTNLADWRRNQVDIFIRDLSSSMRSFNALNNKNVELGISPSGIYRNGNGEVTYDANGTAITNGSTTRGMEHYGEYLYSDSKRWIDEEWIDYIVPQTYWGFTHNTAGYANIVDWWAKVVRNKNVKLYTGMGIYMDAYSWKYNPYEASDQVLYNSKHPEVKGTVIFRYGSILGKLETPGVIRLFNEYWSNKVDTPK